MGKFFREFWLAAKEGPRLYFAPLIGAVRGVREELARCMERH